MLVTQGLASKGKHKKYVMVLSYEVETGITTEMQVSLTPAVFQDEYSSHSSPSLLQ